jgi:hypothetical protein
MAALEGETYLVGEQGALLFVQTEAVGELKFVGGLVLGLAQVGEEAFTEIHGYFRVMARGPCFGIGLRKESGLTAGDENRPRGE